MSSKYLIVLGRLEYQPAQKQISLLRPCLLKNYHCDYTDGLCSSYLLRSFDLVVVIVRCQDNVFMDSIQQPQKEFQGVMLGIPTKLRSVFGHDCLEKGKEDTTDVFSSRLGNYSVSF